MPIQRAQKDGKPGYRWGSTGTVYTYLPGNKSSETKAKEKARDQGIAIGDYQAELIERLQRVRKMSAYIDVPVVQESPLEETYAPLQREVKLTAMRILPSIERDFRNSLRRVIRSRGLTDTGMLVESVEVWATIDAFGVLEVNIEAEDYIKYLYEPFGLADFLDQQIVNRAYMEWLNLKQEQQPMLDWKSLYRPSVVVNLPE